MQSHVGSSNKKGDPDNYLHLFEDAIRMQKGAMPVTCHMFTYCLKDFARIWWNGQKAGSIINYEDLKAKFWSHFSQQKKFMKTHLAVHNFKQREGESTSAFVTRYIDDTLATRPSCEENKEGKSKGFRHSIGSLKVDSKVSPVSFSGEHSWPLGEVLLEITIGDDPFTRMQTLNFVTVRSNSPHNLLLERTTMQMIGILRTIMVEGEQTIFIEKQLPTSFKRKLQDLLRSNGGVFAWTYVDITGILRTIMVEGKPFYTEHMLNEFKHIELVKKTNRGLAPELNEAI
nr:reverse transcriptase domain-containing protein [Tanacetum cinerariifolium]